MSLSISAPYCSSKYKTDPNEVLVPEAIFTNVIPVGGGGGVGKYIEYGGSAPSLPIFFQLRKMS